MLDIAHKETDKLISQVEKELQRNYSECYKTLKRQLDETYTKLDMIDVEDVQKRSQLISRSERLEKMIKELSLEIQNVNKGATDIITNNLYSCYALNFQYGVYLMEHESGINTGISMFNRDAIKKIVKKEFTPFTMIAYDDLVNIDLITRELTRQLTQGLILGESIQKLAKRIKEVTEKNLNDSIRIARTETTRVESEGRQDAFNKGKEMGLKLKKVWRSTLDNRTRTSHAHLMGETRELDEPFSNGLMYPAGQGEAKEVCNCRCSHVVEFVGIEAGTAEKELNEELKRMSFERWQKQWE